MVTLINSSSKGCDIVGDMYEHLMDVVGDLFKIALIAVIVVVILQYTSLYIVAYQTVKAAEETGGFDYATYQDYLDKVSFNTSDVTIDYVSPEWNTKVGKLGDPLTLVIKKSYNITFFNRDISIPITVKKDGINHGYYGIGYGNYDW